MDSIESGGSSSSMERLLKERREQLLTEKEELMRELEPYMEKFAKLRAIEEELKGSD